MQEVGQRSIALAIERREENDHDTQNQSADEHLDPRILALGKPSFHTVGDAQKVERHHGAKDAQDCVERQLRQGEWCFDGEIELHVGTHGEVGHSGSGESRYEQRQGRGGRQVEHKDFDNEEHACERCLEDTGNGACGTAAEQKSHILGRKAEPAADIAADGRACRGYRRLKTHASAECNRQRRGNERRVHVLGRQFGTVAADGQQHRRQAMAYVALDDIAHKQHRQQYTHQRQEEYNDE